MRAPSWAAGHYGTFVATRDGHVQTAVSGHTDTGGHSAAFRALACTGVADARTNTGTAWTAATKGVAVYWLGGAKVADDYADLYDGSWASNAATDESGGAPALAKTFAGCASGGTTGDALGGRWVDVGYPGTRGWEVNQGGHTLHTMERPLYALSPVFEAAPAPAGPGAPVGSGLFSRTHTHARYYSP